MNNIFGKIKTHLHASLLLKVYVKFLLLLSDFFRISPGLYYPKGIQTIKLNGRKFLMYGDGKNSLFPELIFGLNHFYGELNEAKVIEHFSNHFNDFVDVGANAGVFSLYLASKSEKLRIHAFEPGKYNYEILKKNISINNFRNIVPHHTGLGDTNSNVIIESSAKALCSAISVAPGYLKAIHPQIETEHENITLRRMDDYVHEWGIINIDYMKVDVETYEYYVLTGARETIKRYRPFCQVEVILPVVWKMMIKNFPDVNTRAKEIEIFFRNMNYTIYHFTDFGLLEVPCTGISTKCANYLFSPIRFKGSLVPYSELDHYDLNNRK